MLIAQKSEEKCEKCRGRSNENCWAIFLQHRSPSHSQFYNFSSKTTGVVVSTSPIETGRVRARSPFTPARPRCEEDAPRIRMKAQTSIRNVAFFSPERLKKCFYLANLLLVLAFVSTADWRGQMTFELIFVWQYYLYSDTYNIIQYKIQ